THPVGFGKQTVWIANILSYGIGIERQAAETAGSGRGGLRPFHAVRTAQQRVVFHEVERRYALTRSVQPQVRRPRAGHTTSRAGISMNSVRWVVQVTELDMQIIDQRLWRGAGSEPGRSARHVPGKSLLNG